MHAALESLVTNPIKSRDSNEVAAEARIRFDAMLDDQIAQAEARPRERSLQRDQARADGAMEAVVAEALRLRRMGGTADQAAPRRTVPYEAEVEVSVQSADRLFEGTIDRAERDDRGVHLIDYKAATQQDLPDRYRRQIQLYAYLWYETRGEWPKSGRVIYSTLGTSHVVDVDPEECMRVADEARELLAALQEPGSWPMAQPGQVCAGCEYRPWCPPFWEWAARGSSTERLERAQLGIDATVESVRAEATGLRLTLTWGGASTSILLPPDRFAHVGALVAGDRVRLLDIRVRGLRNRPTILPTATTELFHVVGVER